MEANNIQHFDTLTSEASENKFTLNLHLSEIIIEDKIVTYIFAYVTRDLICENIALSDFIIRLKLPSSKCRLQKKKW